jgi:hypothetical protein
MPVLLALLLVDVDSPLGAFFLSEEEIVPPVVILVDCVWTGELGFHKPPIKRCGKQCLNTGRSVSIYIRSDIQYIDSLGRLSTVMD